MIHSFLKNPFENSRAGHDEFGSFALGHLNSLKAQNTDGTYTPMIALVEPPYNLYRKWISNQETTLTTKKGKTLTVNSVLKEFDGFVTDLHEEVFSWKRKKPVSYNALFPHGKMDYNGLTKTDAETIMKRLSDACAVEVDLKQEFKDKSLNLLNQFISVRNAQLEKKGVVKDGSSDGNGLRHELSICMFSVLLDLLKLNVKDTSKVKDFYDTHFIKPKKAKTPPKPKTPGTK